MSHIYAAGATSKMIDVLIRKVDGSKYTGLTYQSAGLLWTYHRGNGSASVAVTLANATLGTFTSGGFKEVDAAKLPGVYQVGIPNAAIASGADYASMVFMGAADMEDLPIRVQISAGNVLDAAVPSVNTIQFAGQTVSAASGVTVPSTLASPTNITAGVITTVTTLTNAPADSSGITTLLSRLSSARAGYLDNLSVGAVAQQATLTALNNLSAAQVKTQIDNALTVDTVAEPVGAPPAAATLARMVAQLHMTLRNGYVSTASQKSFLDDAGNVEWKKAVSDNGTTYTEQEGVVGP